MNSQKLTNLANATVGTDALNLQTANSQFYLNTTELNNIVAPASSLDLNNQKIINLANPTLAKDALNLQTGDSRYYKQTVALNDILAPIGNLSINNHKLTNVAVPTLFSDGANKQYVDDNVGITQAFGDARYYLNTTTLDAIQAPTADVSMNSHNITSLAEPFNNQDAATKHYVDQNTGISQTFADGRYYLNTITLDNI